MRPSIGSIVAISLLQGCAGELVLRPPPPPVDWRSLDTHFATDETNRMGATDKERAAAQAYIKSLGSADSSALAPLLDPHAHFTFAGLNDVHGRGSVVRAHAQHLSPLAGRTFVQRRILLTDNSQAVEWSALPLDPNKQRRVDGITALWTKDDGTISDLHLYFDESQITAPPSAKPDSRETATPAPQIIEQTNTEREVVNVERVRATLDALEEANEVKFLDTIGDNFEITKGIPAKQSHGKSAARAYFQRLNKAIMQLDVQVDNAWGAGSYVVVEYHVVGEQNGPIDNIPAQKDALIQLYTLDVIELQDNKIVHVWRYDNPQQILASRPGA